MTYLIKFDENGRKGATYPVDILMTEERKAELINQGFIETSKEDFVLYCNVNGGKNGTGYIRGKDGKPIDAPPPRSKTKEEKIAQLYSECASDLKAIEADMLQAIVTDGAEMLAELKEERRARIKQYEEDLKKLEV